MTDPEGARRDLLEKVAEDAGVEAELMEAFGPLVDMGPGSRMGFLDKRMTEMVIMGLSKEKGLGLDEKGRNDLRDWDRVREFARRFAESLRG